MRGAAPANPQMAGGRSLSMHGILAEILFDVKQ
jgi:hypothetical protein